MAVAEGSSHAGIKIFLRDIQGRLVAITAQVNMHNERLDSINEMIATSAKTALDKKEDPKRRMMTGIDLREDIQRNDQNKSDLEFNRLKNLMVLKGVDTGCLQKLDRYGPKLAIPFTPLSVRRSSSRTSL